MKKIISIFREIAKVINKIIISICLVFTYDIICIYHLFKKKDKGQWHEYKKKFNELDQTKHLW